MKFLVLTGNPKKDGLCKSITDEIVRGAKDGGAEVEIVSTEKIERCRVCKDGWGICRAEHRCAFEKDGFDEICQKIEAADLLCFITPVYWGETAEGLKSLFDRLRRCQFGTGGSLSGKQVLIIASPGGSGRGLLTCLQQMERFAEHTGAVVFDYVGINRWNNDYKKVAVYNASLAMAKGRKNGDTV